jgi:hypothetical protein
MNRTPTLYEKEFQRREEAERRSNLAYAWVFGFMTATFLLTAYLVVA